MKIISHIAWLPNCEVLHRSSVCLEPTAAFFVAGKLPYASPAPTLDSNLCQTAQPSNMHVEARCAYTYIYGIVLHILMRLYCRTFRFGMCAKNDLQVGVTVGQDDQFNDHMSSYQVGISVASIGRFFSILLHILHHHNRALVDLAHKIAQVNLIEKQFPAWVQMENYQVLRRCEMMPPTVPTTHMQTHVFNAKLHMH